MSWIRLLVVFLFVFSTFTACLAPDVNAAIAPFSENSEEASISELDVDSFAEIFGAVSIPLDVSVRVLVTRLIFEIAPVLMHVIADDVSARGPPLS